jgi:hypothetical protein
MAERPPASAAIVSISLELAAVGIFTLIAGASDEVGTIMLILMAGFWFIFLISEANVFSTLNNVFLNLLSNPSNKA